MTAAVPTRAAAKKKKNEKYNKKSGVQRQKAAVVRRQQAAATALDGEPGQGAGPYILTVPDAEGGDNGGLPA